MTNGQLPVLRNLQEAIVYFSHAENCRDYVRVQRWGDGPVRCIICGRNDVSWLASQGVWQCKSRHRKRQFSLTSGTIFAHSLLSLDKWLIAGWMMANSRNGISAAEMSRTLGIREKSAWLLMHKLREVMGRESGRKMGRVDSAVEVDETFVGGKLKNMHRRRANAIRKVRAAGPYTERMDNKVPVMGIFDRATSTVRAKVIPNVKRETLEGMVKENVKFGATVYSDQAVGYDYLRRWYQHDTVNHDAFYVKGSVHTNCLENFWSLFKRHLRGTYVSVSPRHLQRYLDEQCFRFNHRQLPDSERFSRMVDSMMGRAA